MTQMDTDGNQKADLNSITEQVIGAAFRVHNALGHGFLEKVYENALAHELRRMSIRADQQRRIEVRYDGVVVGDYIADFVVDERVLVEIKAARALDDAHSAQCLNYLAATRLNVCLLLNFGKRVEIKRLIRSDPSGSNSSHDLRPSASSAASSSETPMTWAERAEFDDA
jgi:GxxExxY protein